MIISTEFESTHYGVQEAAGSNPVTRTIKSPEIVRFQDFFFICAPKSVLDFSCMPALRSEAVDAAVIIKHRGIAHTSVKARFASLIK